MQAHFALHITQSVTLIISAANLLLAFDVPEHKILPQKFLSAKDSPYIRSPQSNKD
jgi:hypothetical protein